ncbi:hypothetical protein HYDPIDRAFT_48798, partial [Hydnomerulius pinastri MD-312]
PDTSAERLYNSWKALVPSLIEPYLDYTSRTLGKPLASSPALMSLCKQVICKQKPTKILCLLF